MLTEGWVDYLTGPFGIAFAFAAGVISFLSPCVLPLVPAYIAHLTGLGSSTEATASRRETMSHALAFVLGFGIVFTVIGASVGLAGGLIRDQMPTIEKVAGVFLIILGLNLMGVLRIPWLYRTYQLTPPGDALSIIASNARARRDDEVRALADETKRGLSWAGEDGVPVAVMTPIEVRSTSLSYGRSLGFGAAFAVAWTPCIGPVLGAILTLAAASTTVYQGAYLLLAYSAGLAVPFLIAGIALSTVTATLRRYHHLLPALEVTTGALIVVVGILVFLNEFTTLNQYFDFIPELYGV